MPNANPQASVQAGLPTAVADGTTGAVYDWSDKYGSRWQRPLHDKAAYGVASAGQYFVARNVTPGTGLADHAAPTTLDDLKAFLVVENGDTVGAASAKRIYLDFLKLFVTAAGTGGTNINMTGKTDTNATRRWASGGVVCPPINVNRDSAAASIATVNAGANITVAANAARIVHHQQVRPVIPVVGDTYLVDFGADSKAPSNMAPAGVAIASLVVPAPPVIIGPAQCYLLHKWLAGQSVAGAYEFELGWWEI